MIAWSVSVLLMGLSVAKAPRATFDHRGFCDNHAGGGHVYRRPSPGRRSSDDIQHGGVLVNCEERAVEIRTVLSRPIKAMGKGWLAVQKRYWHDDNCSDPLMAGAIAHGWSLKAVILVGSNEVASFTASCAGE